MLIFVKPNGVEVPVNENSVEAAIALGWTPKPAEVVAEESPEVDTLKRRGRPPKAK